MAAVTKTSISVLASTTNSTYATTKASPAIVGAWVDVTAYNGGVLGGRVKNGSPAPGSAGQMVFQWTPDKDAATPKVYDLWMFGGDSTANSDTTVSIRLDKEIKAVRVVCYGHTSNPVTYESDLAAGS